jgi:hypothetical protein
MATDAGRPPISWTTRMPTTVGAGKQCSRRFLPGGAGIHRVHQCNVRGWGRNAARREPGHEVRYQRLAWRLCGHGATGGTQANTPLTTHAADNVMAQGSGTVSGRL